MISLKASILLPFMWPGVIVGWAEWQSEKESGMRKKMSKLLSSDCMWHMCGCCWLKVVVVIAGLKMPGGGCVPLIPYLISRSRGEALNPKHTHTHTHSLANTRFHVHTHIPPQRHTCHTRMFSVPCLNSMHTKFWNSQENNRLISKYLPKCLLYIRVLQHMFTCLVSQVWPFPLRMYFYPFVFLFGLSICVQPCLCRIALIDDAFCPHLPYRYINTFICTTSVVCSSCCRTLTPYVQRHTWDRGKCHSDGQIRGLTGGSTLYLSSPLLCSAPLYVGQPHSAQLAHSG